MKPNFALNLDHDGISLYHRGASGWTTVGRVALDDADLGAGLAMLRKTAVSLESGGLATKVLIPDSQILYTDLDLPEAPEAEREAMLRERLAGLTPYAVEDLAFDWQSLGPGRVRLAVVARETLAEAEAFASEHRFNPVSFAARPAEGLYDGEPFFGETRAAGALLAGTGAVEPDHDAVNPAPEPDAPGSDAPQAGMPGGRATDGQVAENLAGDDRSPGGGSGNGKAPAGRQSGPASDTLSPPVAAPGGTDGPGKPVAPGDAPAAPASAANGSEPADAVADAARDAPGAALDTAGGAAEAPFTDLSAGDGGKADGDDPAGEAPPAGQNAGAVAPDGPGAKIAGPGRGPEPDAPGDAPPAGSGPGSSSGGGVHVLPLRGPAVDPGGDEAETPEVIDAVAEAAAAAPAFASRRSQRAAARAQRAVGGAVAVPDLPSAPAAPDRPATADGPADATVAAADTAADATSTGAPSVAAPPRGGEPERAAGSLPPGERPAPRLVAGSALGAGDAGAQAAPGAPDGDSGRAALSAPRAGTGSASDAPVLRRLPGMTPRVPPAPPAAPRPAPVVNFAPRRGARPPDPAPATPSPEAGASLRPATTEPVKSVFGARKEPSRRSPAMVVLLTLVLLAGLAVLALWSTFWSNTPLTGSVGDPETEAAGVVAPAAPASADTALADPSPAGPAPGSVESPLPAGDIPDAVAEVPDSTPPPEPVLPAPDADAGGAIETVAGTDGALDPALPEDPGGTVELAALPGAPGAANGVAGDLAALPAEGAADGDLGDAGVAEEGVGDLGAALPAEPDAVPADTASDDAPSIEDEALADGEPDVAEVPAEDGTADAAVAGAVAPDTPALPADPVTELVATDDGAAERVAAQLLEELTPEVAQRRYDGTGVWVLPPESPAEPGVDSVDDLYVAAIDPVIKGEDAVALPTPAPDGVILSPLPPPAAGTTFDFDERGLVRPTPEGAVNPDGILIHSGRPPVTPAPRPGSVAPVVPAPDAGAAPAAAGAVPDDPGLPRVPGVPNTRPKPRPDDLTQLNEKATLGGRTRVELASLRPRQRPALIEALVEAAATPDAAEVALELAPATRFAVPVSRLPRARPDNMKTLVAAAQVVPKLPAPPPVPEVKGKTGTATEEDDGEPVLAAAAVMPKLPTKATVAKSATVANVLNLSKINLIGVYGTPSARRALVRLSNGKFVKLKIGDKLDGGKVAAIGEAELVYVKSGKQVRLAMPAKT